MRYPPRNGYQRIGRKNMIKKEIYIDTISNEKLKKHTYFYDRNKIHKIHYKLNGKFHRSDGPACIFYYDNGKVERELYFKNNKWHREDAPAIIYYYKDGEIERKYYLLNDQLHRETGPACIFYYNDGSIERETYHINGIECDVLQEIVIRGLEEKI